MLKTWLMYHQGRRNELPALLEQLDALIARYPDQQKTSQLVGEIHAVRSLFLFHGGDIKGAVLQARAALERVPPELWNVRGLARLYLGSGLLMMGDESGSLQAIYGAFEEEQVQSEHFKANLLMSVSYIHWVSADLQSMQQAAEQSLALCLELNHQQILGHSQYNLGCVRYQQDDLLAAEELFDSIVRRPYQNFGGCYSRSMCGLSMTYQAQGREDEAQRVVDDAIAFLLKAGNTTQLPLIRALQAEIALQQGDLSAANQWAENLTPDLPMIPLYQFIEPHLTLVKIWLAQNTPASQAKAGVLLTRLQEYLTETHNTRYLIDTLALQALLAEAKGEQAIALVALEKSLRLAQPGGFIRVFADMGSQMSRILSQLKVDRELQTYVGKIQTAFSQLQESVDTKGQDQLEDPLTNRELQVLELLRRRMSNKEIAAQLAISVGTVKGHTVHIYEKLGVKGRRQAVEQAIELGILVSQ